jgi:hypothetical protein
MIKQVWMINREVYEIIIKDKKVFYRDRKTSYPIQMIPKDPRVCKMILTSRNRIDSNLIKQFDLTKAETEEYESAVAQGRDCEETLAKICKKDCLKSGSVLQKEIKE